MFKKKDNAKKKGGKKQIVFIFLICLVLSLLFYLPKELRGWWSMISKPQVIEIRK